MEEIAAGGSDAELGHSGHGHLRSGSVSPIATLFQSISFMAPGAAIVFSLGIAVPLAGNALPISVLIAGVACLFAAVALGQLASAIPSAGGLYAYATLGLGRRPDSWSGGCMLAQRSLFLPLYSHYWAGILRAP
jgi:amino acid transporter